MTRKVLYILNRGIGVLKNFPRNVHIICYVKSPSNLEFHVYQHVIVRRKVFCSQTETFINYIQSDLQGFDGNSQLIIMSYFIYL